MRKSGVVLLVFFVLLSVSSFSFHAEKNSDANTIYVDDDNTDGPWDGSIDHPFQYIQDGIDAADSFEIVYVLNGTYFENIVIEKMVFLSGESRINTIINAGGKKDAAVTLKSPNIEVSGLTVTNASGGWLDYCAGFKILADNCKIYNTTIKDNMFGIQGSHVTNISIINNRFINDGILFGRGDVNSDLRDYHHNIFKNTVNGKPLVYLENKHNYLFSGEVGQLILVNSTNVTIDEININNTDFPVICSYCKNCKIIDSMINNCTGEIWLTNCEDFIVKNNEISSIAIGVCLQFNSNNNTIQNNNILNCTLSGISIQSNSKNNKIKDNLATNNNKGMSIEDSKENIILNNTFLKNKKGGIILSRSNENNIFYNNFILNNIPSACIVNSFFNSWEENYWSRCQSPPKIIPGFISIGNYYIYNSCFPLPSIITYLNFDFCPKVIPYDMGGLFL